MAELLTIKAEIGRLSTIYRQPITPAELAVMAEAWHKSCVDLPDRRFKEATQSFIKHSRYFPTPADILLEAERLPVDTPALPAGKIKTNPGMAILVNAALHGDDESRQFMRERKGDLDAIVARLRGKMKAGAYYEN